MRVLPQRRYFTKYISKLSDNPCVTACDHTMIAIKEYLHDVMYVEAELVFSSFWHRGPIRGRRCIQINVPTKPSYESWERSYLCWPHDGIYKFTWLTQAPSREERGNCLEWTEPRDPTWGSKRYYLCATKDQQPIGMYLRDKPRVQ